MTQLAKAKKRILSQPKDYTYTEAKALLRKLGYDENNKGKTSGSRVKFYRPSDGRIIMLHKPHPTDVMSEGSVKDLVIRLEKLGDI